MVMSGNVEVSVPGYFLYGNDRDRHGGGVLMYIKEHLQVKPLPPCPDLEIHHFCIMIATRFA